MIFSLLCYKECAIFDIESSLLDVKKVSLHARLVLCCKEVSGNDGDDDDPAMKKCTDRLQEKCRLVFSTMWDGLFCCASHQDRCVP